MTTPVFGSETVHLREELVQRVLPLAVAAHGGDGGTGLADGVDLVDEDDAGSLALGLLEEIPHPCGPDADEHLHEA